MANRLSNLMAGRFAAPPVNTPVALKHFKRYGLVVENTILDTDGDGIILPITRLMAHWRILSMFVLNSAITATAAWLLGLYRAGEWSATVDQAPVDADCYQISNAATFATALTRPLRIGDPLAGAAPFSPAGVALATFDRHWGTIHQDALGIAGAAAAPARPGLEYDLCWTVTTAGTATGTVKLLIEYGADY